MDITKGGGHAGGLHDHPSPIDERDIPLSRVFWGDYFQTAAEHIAEWEESHADSEPAPDFSVSFAAPADSGLFF